MTMKELKQVISSAGLYCVEFVGAYCIAQAIELILTSWTAGAVVAVAVAVAVALEAALAAAAIAAAAALAGITFGHTAEIVVFVFFFVYFCYDCTR